MRPIGFSTGALAPGDVERALEMLRGRAVDVVELSALRQGELAPLVALAPGLELARFEAVAVHAPGRIDPGQEEAVVEQLRGLAARGWPIVLHPGAVRDFALWRRLGDRLLVENMDLRKPSGRGAADLEAIFERLPEAGWCFDVGHARQCDASLIEARLMLARLGDRLRHVHLSEVTASSSHQRLSPASILAVRELAASIPERTPIVLESPVTGEQIDDELQAARSALPCDQP
jgi:sugar phosphate isomerase/epimerase